jgi:hypothetical protein
MPNVFVNKIIAFTLRRLIIAELEAKMGQRSSEHGQNSYEDLVDQVVYGGSGKRLPLCHKAARCDCPNNILRMRGKREAEITFDCPKCLGSGRYHEGRPHRPLFVLGSNG